MPRKLIFLSFAGGLLASAVLFTSFDSDAEAQRRNCNLAQVVQQIKANPHNASEIVRAWLSECWGVEFPPAPARSPTPAVVTPSPTPIPTASPTPSPSPEPTASTTPSPAPTDTAAPTATPTPATPTPVPTPDPALAADLRVMSVGFGPPSVGAVGVGFRVTGNVTARNAGPSTPVLGDIAFSLSAPSDCTVSPAMPDIVEDRSLPLDTNVFIGRAWTVTCLQPGAHQLDLTVSAAIDPLHPFWDPDATNNSMSATGSTLVN